MLRKTGSVFFIFLFCILCCQVVFGQKPKDNLETIKVAYPVQDGLTEIGSDGQYMGYTYEYLQEIAQYTGWNYEFIQLDGDLNSNLSEMLEMLQNGEIDIMGGIVNNPQLAEIYDFPGYSYGTAYNTLSVLEENTKINETNYQNLQQIRVAVLERAKTKNQELQSFCETNNINLNLVYCEDDKEQLELLKSNEADAIYNVDLNFVDGVRSIAKFAPQPYYFAITKGRSDIVNKINFAILKINEADPYFETNLYEKYFGVKNKQLFISDEERDYIKQIGTLRVAVVQEDGPIQYFDTKSGEHRGISKEIFEYITKNTGLQFEFLPVQNLKQTKEMIETGKIDAVAGIPYDYEFAQNYNLVLTRPYTSSQVVMIINNRVDIANLSKRKLAMQEDFTFEKIHEGPVIYYDTTQQSLVALNKGEADYGYSNGLAAQFYTNQTFYKNISMIPQLDMEQKVCIGLAKSSNVNLITTINKVIRSIPDSELQAIIYENTMRLPSKITLASFIDANPRETIMAVLIFCSMLVGIIWWFTQTRLKLSRKITLTNERYLQLSELTNEYIFEYDYAVDRLTLSEKSAQMFGCLPVKENIKKNPADLGEEMNIQYKIMGILDEQTENRDLLCQMPDGNSRWFRIRMKVIYGDDDRPIYTIGKLLDIQNEKEEKDILLERSQKDSLTNIYNAATSHRLIEQCIREDIKGALFIIDIDLFKKVNDQYGHYIGDQVLLETASIMTSTFRKDDIVGRLGGDEFVIYMKDNPSEEFIAERCNILMDKIAKINFTGKITSITLSIGVTVVKEDLKYNDYYKRADQALYKVKNSGRDGFLIE